MNEDNMYELNQCTPTREQMWLLQAALQEGDVAKEAWQQWRSHVDLDDVDLPSYFLLPLVYHNLARLHVDDALMGRLKGVSRHTWSKNHMFLHHTQQVVAQLTGAGIRTMFLHGTAMTSGYYQEANTRLMTAIDILVPQAEFLDAVAQLQLDGWELTGYSDDELRWFYRHQLRSFFTFRKGQTVLNLHCTLLPLVRQDEESYWRSARCHRWRGESIYLLDPTQQLFHTCICGMNWSNGYLTWIADALAILAQVAQPNSEATIDWQLLVRQAQATRKILPLLNTLRFLGKEFDAPIPATVPAQLAAIPTTGAEKLEYRLLGTEAAATREPFKRVLVTASRYRTLHQPSATPIRLSSTAWIRYLLRHWQLMHWWELPKQLVFKLYANLRSRHFSTAVEKA